MLFSAGEAVVLDGENISFVISIFAVDAGHH
jgi:hypothetical protein